MKVVIVGGVAGGATAAARLRRLDEKAEIIIFERTGYVSYANCGLPYYIGGAIEDFDDLTLQSPEGFKNRYRIDVRVGHEVTAVDTENKTVTVRNLTDGVSFTEGYDKLLLSPGAKPFIPDIPGARSDKVFVLRTVEDTVLLKRYIEDNAVRSAVIVGGGFIGLELAENLTEKGVGVSVVEYADHVLNIFDKDMACFAQAELKRRGVELHTGTAVTAFKENGGKLQVVAGNKTLTADMAVIAAGVVPDTGFVAAAGIETGGKGRIVVNERMETSASDVYAVGDAVEIRRLAEGSKGLVSLAGPANKQARIAADNIAGLNSEYKGALGTSVIKIFSLTAAAVGMTETRAKALGIDFDKIVLSPLSHASYYPGAKVMTMKVIFDKSSLRILGAQIIGADGADKRIDVIAAAIRAGLTAPELSELELSYAPPYSSAKDPVNVAGYMIEDLAFGKVRQFHYEDIARLDESKALLVDARTPGEYSRGHAAGFKNIPLDEIRDRLNEIDVNKPVYVMCQSGLRSYIACRILTQYGYECYNFSGGYRFFEIQESARRQADNSFPCGMERS